MDVFAIVETGIVFVSFVQIALVFENTNGLTLLIAFLILQSLVSDIREQHPSQRKIQSGHSFPELTWRKLQPYTSFFLIPNENAWQHCRVSHIVYLLPQVVTSIYNSTHSPTKGTQTEYPIIQCLEASAQLHRSWKKLTCWCLLSRSLQPGFLLPLRTRHKVFVLVTQTLRARPYRRVVTY